VLRRVSLRPVLCVLAFSTHPDRQDNAREFQRTPQREFRRSVEHRASTRNQLRMQHEGIANSKALSAL